MSLFTKLGNEIASPVDAAGNPRAVENVDMQRWMTEVERATLAFQAGGGIIFPDKATMDGTLTYAADQMAWVMGDATAGNNGIYRKVGASGSGSWVRLGDLPFSFIMATNAGAGTPDAIVATSSLPVPAADGAALISVNIVSDNTTTPVTVAFNGGPVLTIKTMSGNDVAPGGLKAGMIVTGFKAGSTFRMITDQASAAIQAAAEAAQAAAEAAAAGVNLPSIQPGDTGKTLFVNDTEDGYSLGLPGARAPGSGYSLTPGFIDAGNGPLMNVLQGSAASPVSEDGAAFIVQKHSNTPFAASNTQNAAAFFSHLKNTDGANTKAVALMGEAVDNIGGDDTFIEGMRAHALLRSGSVDGSAYGLIAAAMAEGSVEYKYLIGVESEVRNNLSDAGIGDIPSGGPFAVGFLAVSAGTYLGNAGFATNPNHIGFRYGFLAAANGQDVACFAGFGDAVYGLDLVGFTGSGASIRLPNSSPIRIRNGAGDSDLNVLYMDSANAVELGAEASSLRLRTWDMATPRTVSMGDPDSGGTGYRVLRVSNS